MEKSNSNRYKPHKHGGRFYNHAHDRVSSRLLGVAHYAFLTALKRFNFRRKSFFDKHFLLEDWCITQPFAERSISPVITWIGHATFVVQMNGLNIITDPVYGDISRLFKRYVYPTTTIDQLPPLDVVVISHNHRDHCDTHTLKLLAKQHDPLLLVPLGNKRYGEKLGFSRVIEMNWWDEHLVDTHDGLVRCTFLPASHWTSRGLFDVNHTLWGSWLFSANTDKIYFAGDTAYADHFSLIKKECGPIDVALMPIGPSEPRHLMSDAHVDPYEAIQGFIDLGARYFIPMHWGTFQAGHDRFDSALMLLKEVWSLRHKELGSAVVYPMKFGERWLYPH